MRDSKYQSILRIRNALLLLAVALAVGVALTGWMTFYAPQEDPGTEESELPVDPSAEPSAALPIDPSAKPSAALPIDPSAEPSAALPINPSAEPSAALPVNASAEPSTALPVDASADPSAEASASSGVEESELPQTVPTLSGSAPLELNSEPGNTMEATP